MTMPVFTKKVLVKKEPPIVSSEPVSIGPIAEMHERAIEKERAEHESSKAARVAREYGEAGIKRNEEALLALRGIEIVSGSMKVPGLLSSETAPTKLSKEERRAAVRAVVSVAPAVTATLREIASGEASQRLADVRSAFERAMSAFIDGPVAAVASAFVALYLSTRANDGPEAVAALEACREAFDACNLELADVEVRAVAKALLPAAAPLASKKRKPDAKRAKAAKKKTTSSKKKSVRR